MLQKLILFWASSFPFRFYPCFIISFPFLFLLHNFLSLSIPTLYHFLSFSIPASSFPFPFYPCFIISFPFVSLPSLHYIISLSILPLLNNFLSLYSIYHGSFPFIFFSLFYHFFYHFILYSLLHHFLSLSILSLLIICFPFLPFSYYIISFPFLSFLYKIM